MSDPVAEFLAREQNVLAGIQDDSLGTSPLPYVNNIGSNDAADNGNDIASVNEARVLSGTSDSGLDLPALANGVQHSSTTPVLVNLNPKKPSLATLNNISKPEPEKIKKWREEQKIMLEKKDKNEEKKKEEMRAAGKKELEEWYAQRAEKLKKTRVANR
ncbi:unnamed protein product [Onchocerca flexuosa]|nr:unnamed protein product [Onchocerca flexuosa]